jgi:hypothetical protein
MGFRERPRAWARHAGLKVGVRAQIGGRLSLVLALAATLGALLVLPAVSAGAETGSIKGTVTKLVGGTPIKGTEVCAYTAARAFVRCEETDVGGDYTFAGLPVGEYVVEFYGDVCPLSGECTYPYITQFYNDKSTFANATRISVSTGLTSTANASLEEGGRIEGKVEGSGKSAIPETLVCAYSESKEIEGCARTDRSGEYTIEGLPSAPDYRVYFTGDACTEEGTCSKKPYVAQFYDDASTYAKAEEVEVTAPEDTEGIDATLSGGARIEGTVTNASIYKEPIGGLTVCVEGAESECTSTGEDGKYLLEGLPGGAYTVEFTGEVCGVHAGEFECAQTYLRQYYQGKALKAEAQTISLSAPLLMAGIDASMLEAAPRQPRVLTAPVLSGSLAVGASLSCSPGSWANNPTSLAYAWLRAGVVIPGQTGTTYAIQAADQGQTVTCQVTAVNVAGSVASASNPLSVPLPPPPLPGTAAAGRSAIVKSGTAQLNLACSGQGACSGTLKLVAKVAVKAGKHHKRKLTSVMVGEASFSISAGGYETISVHLTAKGKSLLAKAGKHGLSVLVSGSGVKARTVQLTTAVKKAKR